MNLGFIGIGNVGFALANNFEKKGHKIIIAHNSIKSDSVQKALSKNSNFKVHSIQNTIDKADVIFLATPFPLNENILRPLDFKGKTLIDCTNPVGKGISHGLESKISGAEKVQEWAPTANVIKAFTIYGFENFINPVYPNYNSKPVMLISGNNKASKVMTETLVNDLGYTMKDTGKT